MSAIRVLLVDDNPDDTFMVSAVLAEIPAFELAGTASTGVDGLARLRAAVGTERMLHLVIADLKMPRMDGRELVSAMRANPALAHIPVVIWSGSDRPEDVRSCYAAGASTFVRKPSGIAALRHTLSALAAYWTTVALLP